MDNIVYYDTTNGLWVINDLEGVPAGKALLNYRGTDSDGNDLISLVLPGMYAPIENAVVTDIYSDADRTTKYASLSEFKSTCKALLWGNVKLERMKLKASAQQTITLAGTLVLFDFTEFTNVNSNFPRMAYNSGNISLRGGSCYEVTAAVITGYDSVSDSPNMPFLLNVSGIGYLGSVQYLMGGSSGQTAGFSGGPAHALIDLSAYGHDVLYNLRLVNYNMGESTSLIINYANDIGVESSHQRGAWIDIKEISRC